MTASTPAGQVFHPLTATASALTSQQLREARRFAVQFLYQLDVQQAAVFKETDFQIFAGQLDIPTDERDFVRVLSKETFERLPDIDGLITAHSKNWKLSRIARVDLAIVRACVAELKVRPEVTPAMILADAAEIGKEFGTTGSSVFINGLLDGIAKKNPAVRLGLAAAPRLGDSILRRSARATGSFSHSEYSEAP